MERIVKITAVVVVLVLCGLAQGSGNLVVNSGFEVTEDTDGSWPSSYGDWHGDYSSIVGPTSGITPLEGSQMFKFKGSAWYGPSCSANSCEVPQIIDISQFKSLIETGGVIASASAYFNRVAGDAQTDTKFYMTLYAYEGSPSSYPYKRSHDIYLARCEDAPILFSDSDPATWEQNELQLLLPENTDYIVLTIVAQEDVSNDCSSEFDGHFADQVSLEILPLELIGLEIVGPDEVAGNSMAGYKAIALYDNNSTADVTDSAQWQLSPTMAASIDSNGLLTTEEIYMPQEDITIYTQYGEDGNTVNAEKAVSIFAVCPAGSALDFDGSNDYVDCGDDSSLFGMSELTIGAWIYPRSAGEADSGRIVANDIGGASYAFAMYGNNITSCLYLSGGAVSIHNTDNSVTYNAWHYVVVTYDGSQIKIYVDGTERATKTDGSGTINPGPPVCIGDEGDGLRNFDGMIDDVWIYDRALSVEEILANMHTKLSGDEPNLVGYWDFDEGEGQVAYDSSGNGNDGRLGNNPEVDNSDPAWVDSNAPTGICTPQQLIERNITDAMEIKMGILEEIGTALLKENAAIAILEELFRVGDYGQLNKNDIVRAKQDIHSAVQHQQQAASALDKSIEGLYDTLTALGWEPEPEIVYEISDDCAGVLSATEESEELRFRVTVEGQYIYFEDMMVANCCTDALELDMEVEDNLITVHEIEHTTSHCWCICDYEVTATLGPFEPGIYTIEVYEDFGGFIGSKIVTIE